MPATTIPEVKEKLVALFTAEAALSGVQVSYGHPGKMLERETVIVGDVRGRQDPATLGNRSRDERYVVEVISNVAKKTNDQQAVTERAIVLSSAVEDALRSNETLDDLVLWAMPGEYEVVERLSDMGREAEVRIQVEIRSRI